MSGLNPSTSSSSSGQTVPVLLTTRTAYPLPPTRYLIPTSFTRFQLSQLINASLSLSPPVPFDFLIRPSNHLLRGTLAQYLAAIGQTAEQVLELEYVRSALPPQLRAEIPQDDWVSSVSLQMRGGIISGAYDNTVRIYTDAQEEVCVIRSHQGPVTGVQAFEAPAASGLEGHFLASSSHDRTVHLHHLPPSLLSPPYPKSELEEGGPRLLSTLHTSNAQVSSVSVSPQGTHLATATWDGLVGVFDTHLPTSHELPAEDDSTSPEDSRRKRRKLRSDDSTAVNGHTNGGAEVFRKAPMLVLKGHSGKVSKAVFGGDGKELFSAGWDFTVRQWDAESGRAGVIKTTPDRVHLTLARMAGPTPLLTTGTSDRLVALFDPRSTSTISLTLPHSSPVPALAPHPSAAHLLTSATLTGILQIWDLRSPRESLVRVQREGGKCLCIDWRVRDSGLGGSAGGGAAAEGVWATGGEDKKVQVFETVVREGEARVGAVGRVRQDAAPSVEADGVGAAPGTPAPAPLGAGVTA